MHIPTGLDDLTPEWLTRALRTTGTIQSANVVSSQASVPGEGRGVASLLARLSLEYDIDEEGAPRSLICKLPSLNPLMRGGAIAARTYHREVRFYQRIAGEIALRTPRCYYSDLDESGAFVLLLEDLAPARCGDTLAGCSLTEAELAVRELARFHAAWWESPRLAEIDWLWESDPVRLRQFLTFGHQYVQRAWEPFLALMGEDLPLGMRELGERLVAQAFDVWSCLRSRSPRTLIHGDYHLDNLFYASSLGDVPFAVVDWQALSLGVGVQDVGFFMCRSFSPAERREGEMDLLRLYHDTLVEDGVEGYTFEETLNDYRFTALEGLLRMVIMAGAGMSPEKERVYREILLPRCCAAVLDHDAGALLP